MGWASCLPDFSLWHGGCPSFRPTGSVLLPPSQQATKPTFQQGGEGQAHDHRDLWPHPTLTAQKLQVHRAREPAVGDTSPADGVLPPPQCNVWTTRETLAMPLGPRKIPGNQGANETAHAPLPVPNQAFARLSLQLQALRTWTFWCSQVGTGSVPWNCKLRLPLGTSGCSCRRRARQGGGGHLGKVTDPIHGAWRGMGVGSGGHFPPVGSP